MIQPITHIISNGIHSAVANFENNGVTVKFMESNPEFQTKVSQICDEFIYNATEQQTKEGLVKIIEKIFSKKV